VPKKHPKPKAAARPLLAITLPALCAVILAACGSSGNSGGNGGGASGSSAGANATVKVGSVSGFGKALTTSDGAPLYIFTGDKSGASNCTGTCAKQWPPLTVSGTPSAGSGAQSGLLSTSKRQDGTKQVLYNGHPLYTHAGSSPASSVAGSAANGGIWYLISPAGKPITKTNSGGY
jgi:predicted lipoprotein with Yx(FWY)xxD motif